MNNMARPSIASHMQLPPGPPEGNRPNPIFIFGIITDRSHFASTVELLINTVNDGEFIYQQPLNRSTQLKTGTTVRFVFPPVPSYTAFKRTTAIEIDTLTVWKEPILSEMLAPTMRGQVTTLTGDNKGRITPEGSTGWFIPFIANKLTEDSIRPVVGSRVIFSTFSVDLPEGRSALRVYRVQLDPEYVNITRQFIAPTHLINTLLDLTPTPFNIFIGDWDEPTLVDANSAHYTHHDYSTHFRSGCSLESIPLQMVIDFLIEKYTTREKKLKKQCLDRLGISPTEESVRAVNHDPEVVKVQKITSAFRRFGKPGPQVVSVFVNPLPWLGSELQGAKGRFLWTDFAEWANVFLTHGANAKHVAQVLILRPHNHWADVPELKLNLVDGDFSKSIRFKNHYQGSLLCDQIINMGSYDLASGEIQRKFSNGLLRLSVSVFSSPLIFSSTKTSALLEENTIVELEVLPDEEMSQENVSATDSRNSPLPFDDPNSLVVMHPVRNLDINRLELILDFQRKGHKVISPWVAPPPGFAAYWVKPESGAHRVVIEGWLSQPSHLGFFMHMRAGNYFNCVPTIVDGSPILPVALVEFAFFDSSSAILLKILGQQGSFELAPLDRRTIKVWHPEGSLKVATLLASVNARMHFKGHRAPFHSIRYSSLGDKTFFAPSKEGYNHRTTPQRCDSPSSLHSVVLGGVNHLTSEAVLSLAFTHFLGDSPPIRGEFVTDPWGAVSLRCFLSSATQVQDALLKPRELRLADCPRQHLHPLLHLPKSCLKLPPPPPPPA